MTEGEKEILERSLVLHWAHPGAVAQVMKSLDGKEKKFSVIDKGKVGDIEYRATLNFERPGGTKRVDFKDFILTVRPTGRRTPFSQAFPIKHKSDFTIREAFNLMNGRYVSKEMMQGENKTHKPWLKMDFSNVDDSLNHPITEVIPPEGFDLMKELVRFPIVNFNPNSNGRELVKDLERGDLRPVTLKLNGWLEEFSLAANPEAGGLDVYKNSGVKLSPETILLIEKPAGRKGQALKGDDLGEGRGKGKAGEGKNSNAQAQGKSGDGGDGKKIKAKRR